MASVCVSPQTAGKPPKLRWVASSVVCFWSTRHLRWWWWPWHKTRMYKRLTKSGDGHTSTYHSSSPLSSSCAFWTSHKHTHYTHWGYCLLRTNYHLDYTFHWPLLVPLLSNLMETVDFRVVSGSDKSIYLSSWLHADRRPPRQRRAAYGRLIIFYWFFSFFVFIFICAFIASSSNAFIRMLIAHDVWASARWHEREYMHVYGNECVSKSRNNGIFQDMDYVRHTQWIVKQNKKPSQRRFNVKCVGTYYILALLNINRKLLPTALGGIE